MKQFIYTFEEGSKEMKNLLGGKGANVAEMTRLGLPVPPGFTITTEYCNHYLSTGKHVPEFEETLLSSMSALEKKMSKKFGDPSNPLLVSVRSGARASMPGMMDTVLNLGLNDKTVESLATLTSNPRFAYDAYRRFLQMFGDVVLGIEKDHFNEILDEIKKSPPPAKGEVARSAGGGHRRAREVNREPKGFPLPDKEGGQGGGPARSDQDLTLSELKTIVEKFKQVILTHSGQPFPSNPVDQLHKAIIAVFNSWNNARAITYRRLNHIPSDWGTAVNVQSMVFGNLGNTSGTGVAFTRDPSTGQKEHFGEYLTNAQGEDVVAGIRTPKHLDDLEKEMPQVYSQLVEIFLKLESHYKDMQDIEFTIENGKLFMLQCRNGKRTGRAAVKIAIDMVSEGLIDQKTAVLRVAPESLDQLLHPSIDPKAPKEVIAKGLPASPGAVSGHIVFTAEDAVDWVKSGKKVILVRHETSPEDIEGMNAAEGILTAVGGMTSHAAVVARGMGKCCVAGATAIRVNTKTKTMSINLVDYHEGDTITIEGSTGEVMKGKVPTVPPRVDENFTTLMQWADTFRKVGVRANAETPADCHQARSFGAEGIGLCRTEHMFFSAERITHVRRMIVAETLEDRIKAIDALLPYQQSDFEELFRIMSGYPVTIRLLDPPLHEFVPHEEPEISQVAAELNIPVEKLKGRLSALHEVNPMLGHRGCRLAVTYPELPVMQTKAIIQAALKVQSEGVTVIPEIMIPLVGLASEIELLSKLVRKHADRLVEESGKKLEYTVGTMIEIPRACIVADKIARHADFFSFGTNDLTQMGFGISRDDGGKFLPEYVERGLIPSDPFQHLDEEGIGGLIQLGVKGGRTTKPDLKIGICGEHGGDPQSIKFCIENGFNYVSCSPFRVPIAKLAAAQKAITP